MAANADEVGRESPDIQLFCNLVIRRADGRVMLVKPDAADERWWLPWADLEPYQHPDDAVRVALTKLGLAGARVRFAQIQSFRGRRGWHVTFDYLVEASGDAPGSGETAGWFAENELPRTVHGEWEKQVVRDVVAKASAALTAPARG